MDPNSYQVLDTILTYEFPTSDDTVNNMLSSLAINYSEDGSERKVLSLWGRRQDDDYHLLSYSPSSGSFDTLHEVSLSEVNEGSQIYSATSWETHRRNPFLKLDIDYDDSGGRLGPHRYVPRQCESRYFITDDDVTINRLGGPIDSMTVKLVDGGLSPGQEFLRIPDLLPGGISVVNEGDTLFQFYPFPGGSPDGAWIFLLRQLYFETDGSELPEGERVVETRLYADGRSSDVAKTFIQYENAFEPAGQDSTLVACPLPAYNLFDYLGGPKFEGGYWEPTLSGSPENPNSWRYIESDIGTFKYIIDRPGCVADTAEVVIELFPDPTPLIPFANDTVKLCSATDSVIWTPTQSDEIDLVGWAVPPSQTDPTLTLGIDESAAVYVDDQYGCLNFITLFTELDSNQLIMESVEVDLCTEDTLLFAGEIYTEGGVYPDIFVESTGCDTLYELTINSVGFVEQTIDTLISLGDTLRFADTTIYTVGNYQLFLPATIGCDTLLKLSVDILNSTSSIYASTGDHRIINPIKKGQQSLAIFDLSGKPLPISQLEVYNVWGQNLASLNRQKSIEWIPPGHWASGIYLFRYRTQNDDRWWTAKVKIF
ncbi:MAG: hypothetical protein AAF741_08565 [Bacteroidota bacterium]